MSNKIKSIEKGWGDNSTFFSTSENALEMYRVSEIKEETKTIKWDCGLDLDYIRVYNVYDSKGNIIAEIEANSCLTICYESVS